MKKILYTLILLLIFTGVGIPATYYMRNDGTAANKGAATGCSLASTAMNESVHNSQTFIPGDIIKLCNDGGTFDGQIIPPSSGSDSTTNLITYEKAQETKPILTRTGGSSFLVSNKNYIKVDGLQFGNSTSVFGTFNHLIVADSNYVEIANCLFYNSNYGSISIGPYMDSSYHPSDYNYIHDCVFQPGYEAYNEETEVDVVHIFHESDHNRVINNDFYEGGGHFFVMVSQYSNYNVIRGNNFIVTDYWDTATSPDNASIDGAISAEQNSNYLLIEDNVMTIDLSGGEIEARSEFLQHDTCRFGIIRRNIQHKSRGGFYSSQIATDTGYDQYNMIYNNTMYNISRWDHSTDHVFGIGGGGGTTPYNQYDTNNYFVNNLVHTTEHFFIRLGGDYSQGDQYVTNNIFNNNIFYNITIDEDISRFRVSIDLAVAQAYNGGTGVYPQGNTFTNNFQTEPTFTDAANGDFTADDGEAPQVDSGAWLTTIYGSGTTYTVAVPYFFYYGWGTPGETGDVIKTADGASATITSINYGTGVITVNQTLGTISSGSPIGVALSYNGNKPDIGAEEYGSSPDPEDFNPSNGATGQALDVDMTFTGYVGITYDVLVSTSACGSVVVDANCDGISQSGGTVTCDPSGDWANSQTVYWRVLDNDSTLYYPSDSTCFSFTTIGTPPSGASLTPDTGGALITPDVGGVVYLAAPF